MKFLLLIIAISLALACPTFAFDSNPKSPAQMEAERDEAAKAIRERLAQEQTADEKAIELFKRGPDPTGKCEGFRGLCWGQDKNTIGKLVKSGNDPSFGGIDLYTRVGEDLTIGTAKLDTILYGFYREQLLLVNIYASGFTNFSSIKEAAFAKFGSLFKGNRFMERYVGNTEETTVYLDYKEVAEKTKLVLGCRRLTELAQKVHTVRSRQGGKSGF